MTKPMAKATAKARANSSWAGMRSIRCNMLATSGIKPRLRQPNCPQACISGMLAGGQGAKEGRKPLSGTF